jgi:hypothetical protein
VSEVEFLPAWYPRKRRLRGQIIVSIYAVAVLVVLGAVGWMWA